MRFLTSENGVMFWISDRPFIDNSEVVSQIEFVVGFSLPIAMIFVLNVFEFSNCNVILIPRSEIERIQYLSIKLIN